MGVRLPTPAPLRRLVRTRWLRHLLLGFSLVVVMLSIVGMHQLSVGHDVASGRQHGAHEHAAAATPLDAAARSHSSDSVMAVTDAGLHPGHATSGGAGLGANDCPTCGEHELALGSCLLALTLLALSWLLLPPRWRQLPPFLRLRLPPALLRPGHERIIPALSLTELSLRRT